MSDKELIEALVGKGFSAREALAIVGGSAPSKAPKKAAPKAKSGFYEAVIATRVPCSYKSASCKGHHFAAGGVGSKQHTTCPKGRAALKAARS